MSRALFAGRTPQEDVQRREELAKQLLSGGSDTSPISHPMEAFARMAQSGVGAWQDRRAQADKLRLNNPMLFAGKNLKNNGLW